MRTFARWVVRLGSAARATEGVVDFQSRRYMLFGPYAQVYVDGTHWGGAPGRGLSSLTRSRDTPAVALWLCDLLQIVVGAHELGREQVRGRSCQAFFVELDLVKLPSRWRGNPDALEPVVWIGDDGYVRRIEVHAEDRSQLIELWDFGTRVDELDWTRLPTRQSVDDS